MTDIYLWEDVPETVTLHFEDHKVVVSNMGEFHIVKEDGCWYEGSFDEYL